MMVPACRFCISHQLRDYNPRQLGFCNFSSNPFRCCGTKSLPCSLFASKRSSRFKLASRASYSSSSSSSVTDDTGDLARVSYDYCVQGVNPSFSQNENGRPPPTEEVASVAGGIVALGKFDALHIGHRELAIQASKIGVPYLLSFVGMAEVLGWEQRPPIVAQCDRKRVLSSWAPLCGNIIPKEYHVEFSKVRHLTPQQFVEKLSEELGVRGVVAGQNYRFGYKAAGNSSDLMRLCKDYGMDACIIRSVMDKNQESTIDKGSSNPHDQGQVSSTRVRYALSIGDMKYVSELLGRSHRLVLKGKFSLDGKRLSAPRSCLLNLPPTEGLYDNCSLIIGEENVVPCRIIIDSTDIHLELLDESAPDVIITTQNCELLSIEFGASKA